MTASPFPGDRRAAVSLTYDDCLPCHRLAVAPALDAAAILSVLPHAKAGKVRLLATSALTRSQAAKDTPTLHEAGVPNFEVVGWFALMGPANIPAPIVSKLNTEVLRIMALPETQERLATLGFDPLPMGVKESGAYIADQLGKFKTMVTAAGAQVD